MPVKPPAASPSIPDRPPARTLRPMRVLLILLAASSLAHAGLMRIPLGKAIEVWFVQRMLLLGLVAVVVAAAVAAVLVRQAA